MGLARKNELACCDSGPRVTAATRRFFLTMQLVAKGYTESVASSSTKVAPSVDVRRECAIRPAAFKASGHQSKTQSGSRKACHGFLAGASPSLTAVFTKSATDPAFIF